MNKCCLSGNVASSLELRYTNTTGKPVVNFSLAIREYYANKDNPPVFIDITVWDKLAIACNDNIHKGDRINVCGHLRTQSYLNQQQVKITRHYIEADSVEFDPRNIVPTSKNAPIFVEPHIAGMENTAAGDDDIPF